MRASPTLRKGRPCVGGSLRFAFCVHARRSFESLLELLSQSIDRETVPSRVLGTPGRRVARVAVGCFRATNRRHVAVAQPQAERCSVAHVAVDGTPHRSSSSHRVLTSARPCCSPPHRVSHPRQRWATASWSGASRLRGLPATGDLPPMSTAIAHRRLGSSHPRRHSPAEGTSTAMCGKRSSGRCAWSKWLRAARASTPKTREREAWRFSSDGRAVASLASRPFPPSRTTP